MLDTHYDLLTKLYICYKRNDFSYIENWMKNYNQDNVNGIIANLCFMSKDEMKNEYDKDYFKDGDSVIDIFRVSISLLKKYMPNNIKVYTSIEGCDYLNNENDLVVLKELGLDAIVPVWNCKSRFGSGNRSDDGLTLLGEKLISKAVELDLGIDLSHANEKTFWDIINYIKNNNLDAKIYASHSNARSLCERTRNLDDRQLERIKEIGGLVGVFSNRNFVVNDPKDYDIADKRKEYIDHIEHVKNIVGEDNVILSTDDMEFCGWYDSEYYETSIYDYSTIACELFNDLVNRFGEDISANMMYNNVKNKIWCNIKNRRNYERSKS